MNIMKGITINKGLEDEKTVKVSSLKSRDAQKYWGILKDMESQDDDSKVLEITEQLQRATSDFIKTYAGLTDDELEELTVDDRTQFTDYFIDQARQFVAGFSSASLKSDS